MKKLVIAAAVACIGMSFSASAETLKFANTGATLPSSIQGTDLCKDADICSKKINYDTVAGNLAVTASVKSGKKRVEGVVIQDLSPKNGGLGVLKAGKNGGSDNIDAGEWLTLSFTQQVEISSITFFNEDHKKTFDADAKWGLSIDGHAVKDYKLTNVFNPKKPFIGTTFTFVGLEADSSYCDPINQAFYVGGLTISAVPEPSTYAMMLGGISVLGLIARRRRNAA